MASRGRKGRQGNARAKTALPARSPRGRSRASSASTPGPQASPLPSAAGLPPEVQKLRRRLSRLPLPSGVFQVVARELEELASKGDGSDIAPSLRFLNCVADIPWNARAGKAPSFSEAKRILEESHYGMERVKERIVEQLAVMRLKSSARGQILLLCGPPGVGKTSLAKAVAESLGRPLVRLALGGVSDEHEIRGHRRTYINSKPGRLIDGIIRAGSRSPVVLLDEIDKIGGTAGAQAASGVVASLLEVLDPEQNSQFQDHYLGFPVDLSGAFFVATANSIDDMPRPLLDRAEVIWLSAYTDEEKLAIAKEHLLPTICEETGLKPTQMRLESTEIELVMRQYTREAGVRQLRRELLTLARKVARDVVEAGPTATIRRYRKVTQADIRRWLGVPRFPSETREENLSTGVAVGLSCSDTGGELLLVESSRSVARSRQHGQGQLQLTGNLGKTLRESALTALSYILSKSDLLGIDADEVEKSNLHINLPDGGVPKDGPSAGIALLTSLVSLFLNRPVPSTIAMTGEITLRGRVQAVGGIREKLIAAYRAGMTKALIPLANWHDVDDLPKAVRQKLTVIPVSTMEEVLAHTGLQDHGMKDLAQREGPREGLKDRGSREGRDHPHRRERLEEADDSTATEEPPRATAESASDVQVPGLTTESGDRGNG